MRKLLLFAFLAGCASAPVQEKGSIDADAIAEALQARRADFRDCYEKGTAKLKPRPAGSVHVAFSIDKDGKSFKRRIETTELKHPKVESCILEIIGKIQFPVPAGPGHVEVTYPFKFKSE